MVDFSDQLDQLKRRIHELWAEWLEFAERRPRLVRSLLIGFGIVAAVTIIPTVVVCHRSSKGAAG